MPVRILLVGCPHGNERLGLRLYRYMQRQRPDLLPHVDYICGNPKAYRQNVRYTETDFNRSFGVAEPRSYEERRAAKVLQRIVAGEYTHVLDIHTTVAPVERFFLATHLGPRIREMIGASRLHQVALMPPEIADCSLIGNVPQAISVEYNRDLASTATAVREMIEMITNLLAKKTLQLEREVYHVAATIPLDAALDAQAANFELCNLGYYPVLLDYGSYVTFKGFAAPQKTVTVV